ncbi:MAG: DsbA family oxidoreductase [Hydrogenophaga sp.]|nr:DsbA family oxidoreductase [Hydrogenophaga sp.]
MKPVGPSVRIEVWFDLICPWCLIGKRQLDAALAQWQTEQPEVAVTVCWHPVRLIDGVPPEGWDFARFYEQRLGSPQAVQARQAQVLAAARQAGAEIDFARIRVFPDTGPAHQLLAAAGRRLGAAAHQALIERLFQAYFQRGENLADQSTLLDIATEAGLDPIEVACRLDLPLPSGAPVNGVPLFVFNGRLALSGAQPVSSLLAAMRTAMAEATATA